MREDQEREFWARVDTSAGGISGTHAGRVSMLALRRREPHREVRLGN